MTTVQSNSGTIDEQVRAVVKERVEAISAMDPSRLVALYAPDITLFNLAPPLRQPAREVLDPRTTQAWFDGFESGVSWQVSDLVVEAGADIAFCHALVCLTATPKGAPAAFELWFRLTLGLRRTGDRWLIVHEHESTPFHMDGTNGSFRAATDLQP